MVIACYGCGIVVESHFLRSETKKLGETLQLSSYCPNCGALLARTLDGEPVKISAVEDLAALDDEADAAPDDEADARDRLDEVLDREG